MKAYTILFPTIGCLTSFVVSIYCLFIGQYIPFALCLAFSSGIWYQTRKDEYKYNMLAGEVEVIKAQAAAQQVQIEQEEAPLEYIDEEEEPRMGLRKVQTPKTKKNVEIDE